MLYCKKLGENAILPSVSHAGEDLGYDIYSAETKTLISGIVTKIKTEISARFIDDTIRYERLGGNSQRIEETFGLLLRDRSSMAAKGITVSAGVIDAGYTGEIIVLLTLNTPDSEFEIKQGDKIAQMIPMKVLTKCGVQEVTNLLTSQRGEKGFGSSGI